MSGHAKINGFGIPGSHVVTYGLGGNIHITGELTLAQSRLGSLRGGAEVTFDTVTSDFKVSKIGRATVVAAEFDPAKSHPFHLVLQEIFPNKRAGRSINPQ